MEMNYESSLRSIDELMQAISACRMRSTACEIDICPIPKIMHKSMSKILAGKTLTVGEIVNSTLKECEEMQGQQCTYLGQLKTRINRSASAYKSEDGEKFWPDPTSDRKENRKSRFDKYKRSSIDIPKRDYGSLENSVATMGSCFMNEINKHLLQDRLLIQIDESDCETDHTFPVRWGTIFNPLSAKKTIDYYLGIGTRPNMLWKSEHSGEPLWYDPFREDVVFKSIEMHNKNSIVNRRNGYNVLKECGVFIGAFSMIETWLSSDESSYPLSRAPWLLNPLCAHPYTLSYAETLEALMGLIDSIRDANPACRIILGVDPVPLHATHTHKSALIADSRAKAQLIAATQEAVIKCSHKGVEYLPCYEIIHYCTRSPWAEDERHLALSAVNNVYQYLSEILVNGGGNGLS
jgi:hypothetical protein